MPTLIIDTSGAYTTVAVIQDDTPLGYTALKTQPLTHLHDQIRTLARLLALDVADFDRIGVVSGPGSWTGLNIGVTAAKTLAQVLGVPVVALPTLDALVAARRWTRGRVCALLNAKRANVYYAWYATDEAGVVHLADRHAGVMPYAAWAETLAQEDGVPLVVEYGHAYRERIERHRPAAHVDSQALLSLDGLLLTLQAHRADSRSGDDLLPLSPDYLQPTLAERDWPSGS